MPYVYRLQNTVFLRVSNIYKRLNGDIAASSKCIKWADRLSVATDAAYALSYMHNALRKSVVHRDVNSLNIPLDYSLRGKLANLGYSVSINPRETPQMRCPVEGTPGYIDPEYRDTQEVTDKCDVYSFGVFMLTVLTESSLV
ncbi:probable LRR receptor-like serine/threonine-protein kinase At5g16900 [Beta vulgaris subsp. vulgaris]|uniref:probable LRR receptor-like serine/threonine-protein kinase At5g16900 n=1 Tax=Beta vulgaris subsp. vulgaris TaxID=3555 RepID=UPI0005401D0F|nr:probable LRR receptor-like serine/threonine-protein kinase At5g16900 [Beta vulgaris subsp. vulgaris]